MFSLGVAYLLGNSRIVKSNQLTKVNMFWSRTLLGVQIGLIVLAMIVTRLSVASLQAKQGLPIGNQVVGWLILGKTLPRSVSQLTG